MRPLHVQVRAFSGKYSAGTPDSLLPSCGHPADDVQDPGFVQVRVFLMIALARASLLPALGHPAYRVQGPGYCKMMQNQRAQVRTFSCKHPALVHDCLLSVLCYPADFTQGLGYCKTLRQEHAKVRDF